MISDFIKAAQIALSVVNMLQQGATALGEAAVWAAMYQPIIDAASGEEKKRLEALGNAVALRIMLGMKPDKADNVVENLQNIGPILAKLPSELAATANAALTGAGLKDYAAGGSAEFNKDANLLLADFMREKARIESSGNNLLDMSKASYASNDEQVALKESSFVLHSDNTGKPPVKIIDKRTSAIVDQNLKRKKEEPQEKYAKSAKNPREAFQETLRSHFTTKPELGMSPIRLRLGQKDVLMVPNSLSDRWRKYHEIKEVTSKSALGSQLQSGQTIGRARKDLKYEIDVLRDINQQWAHAKDFMAVGDSDFKKAPFPIGTNKSNKYEAILLLAVFAVKVYRGKGLEGEIKGLNVYQLASLVRWEDIEKASTLTLTDGLADYFSPPQIAILKNIKLEKGDFNRDNFNGLSAAAVEHGNKGAYYAETLLLLSGMDQYFEKEQTLLLGLIATSAKAIAEGTVDKKDRPMVLIRLNEISAQLLSLRKNRGNQPEKTIPELIKDLGNVYSVEDQHKITEGLHLASTVEVTKSVAQENEAPTVRDLGEQKKRLAELKATIIALKSLNDFVGTPLQKQLDVIYAHASEKIDNLSREDQKGKILSAASNAKNVFRGAVAAFGAEKYAVKTDETKLEIIDSTLAVAETLAQLVLSNSDKADIDADVQKNEAALKIAHLELAEKKEELNNKSSELEALEQELIALDQDLPAAKERVVKEVAEAVIALDLKLGDCRKKLMQIEDGLRHKKDLIETSYKDTRSSLSEKLKKAVETKDAPQAAIITEQLSQNEKNYAEKIQKHNAEAQSQKEAELLSITIIQAEISRMPNIEKDRLQQLESETAQKKVQIQERIEVCKQDKESLSGEHFDCIKKVSDLEDKQEELRAAKSSEELIVELHDTLIEHDKSDKNNQYQGKVEDLLKADKGYPSVEEARKRLGTEAKSVGKERESNDTNDNQSRRSSSTSSTNSNR